MSKSKQNANYQEIPNLLHHREEFTGHSMSARWEYGKQVNFEGRRMLNGEWFDDQWYYIVYSYSLPIAAYDPAQRTKYVKRGKISRTTSRHQTLAAAWLDAEEEVAT